ncbi:MAG TPA: condensation domain-containing protein, partial [Polyangiales bacterium]|nr:condensation domain-containing protein [Polyangiales bacterium]
MAKNDIETILPLSPLQHGLLFHALADRSHDPYFIQAGFALDGALDTDAFQRAWQWVAQRHGILRTGFVWEKVEQPLQVVRTQAVIPLHQHDLRAHPDPQGELTRILREDRALGFDLLKAPLMRLTLIRLEEQRHYFFNSHHHLLVDGWSFALLLREATLAYEALRRGREPALPPTASYRSYLAWVGKRDRASAERFFREALARFGSSTPLPYDERLPRQEQPFAEQERSFSLAETA